jgi:hypothetical protein
MFTSHKSIETSGKVMLHELCDAQISAELTLYFAPLSINGSKVELMV